MVAIAIVAACAVVGYFGNRWIASDKTASDPKVTAAEENAKKISENMQKDAPPPPPDIERTAGRGAIAMPKK